MWSPNGKVLSPETKNVESKIITHLSNTQHVKQCYVF